MPGKRHGRHKQFRSKKRHSISAIGAQQQVVAQTYKPAPRPEVSTPSASVPSKVAALSATQYSYVVDELKRIGILTGAILVILVILYLIFS